MKFGFLCKCDIYYYNNEYIIYYYNSVIMMDQIHSLIHIWCL